MVLSQRNYVNVGPPHGDRTAWWQEWPHILLLRFKCFQIVIEWDVINLKLFNWSTSTFISKTARRLISVTNPLQFTVRKFPYKYQITPIHAKWCYTMDRVKILIGNPRKVYLGSNGATKRFFCLNPQQLRPSRHFRPSGMGMHNEPPSNKKKLCWRNKPKTFDCFQWGHSKEFWSVFT